MLSLQNVSFQYKKHTILDQVNLEIKKGTCTCLVGANGCGKSTFLSIIAGSRKSAGQLIDNATQESYSLGKNKRPSYIGYIPQDNPLLDTLSGLDNLKLWFRGNKDEFNQTLNEPLIEMLGIKEFYTREVRKMSGGMKKRISIAIGLINHPSLLILDEPSAALDMPCKYDITKYLNEYKAQGGTIILTTHEPDELNLCDQLYVLKEGKLTNVDASLRGADLIKHF